MMHMPSFWPCLRFLSCSGLLAVACMYLVGCKGNDDRAKPNSASAEQSPLNRSVTKENFEKIREGMTFKEVHDLLGASETLRVDENTVTRDGKVSGHAIEIRRWRDGASWIVVTFD